MSVDVIIPWQPGCSYRAMNLAWTVAKWRSITAEPVLGELPEGQPFVKALAVAAAVERSTADVLVITDGDLWVEETILAIDAVLEGAPWSSPHHTINRMNPAATSRVLSGGALGPPLAQRSYRAVPGGGVMVIRRDVYDEVPLDPRFVGWGGEDESWGVALRCLYPAGREGRGDLWHLWHPPADRLNRRNGSAESTRLRNRYMMARQSPDAMRALLAEV